MEVPICCNFRCTARLARMPERFRHRMRVRFNECDPQGVVFYANYLMYFDVAMTEFWREAFGGYAELIEGGTDAMVAEARIRYLAPARFDDEIDLVASVASVGSTSSVVKVAVQRVADGVGLVEGELRHVFVDTRDYRKREIPSHVRQGLERFLAGAGARSVPADSPADGFPG
jgi:acyl-CoA thioester hydrolase